MSTSVAIVNSGTVALDSAIRRAMTCWVRVSSWTVDVALGGAGLGDARRRGAGRRRGRRGRPAARGRRRLGARARPAAGAGAVPDAAASTSAFTIRPPGPLPCRPERSMPCSRAMRRATGDAFARPPLPSRRRAAGLGAGAAGSGLRCRRGRLGRGGRRRRRRRLARLRRCPTPRPLGRLGLARRRRPRASPPAPMRAMTWPIGSVSPSWATIASVPARVGLVGHRGLVGLDLDELVARARPRRPRPSAT